MTTSNRATGGAGAVLALVLGGTLLGVPAGAVTTPGPATGVAATAGPAGAGPVKRVSVAYGDGPVSVDRRGQRVRISFRGRRGDVVSLDTGARDGLTGSRTRLLRGDRSLEPTWPFVWRLRGNGVHTFSFRAAPGDSPGRLLQLVKGRVHRLEVDGWAFTPTGQRPGFVDYALVRVPRGDRVLLASGEYGQDVLTPDGGRHRMYGGSMLLEPGLPVRTTAGDTTISPLAPGRVLVTVKEPRPVRALRSVVIPADLDGRPVRIEPDGSGREQVLVFEASGDQLVHPQLSGARSRGRPSLSDPASNDIASFGHGRTAYFLDDPVTYRLSYFPTSRTPFTVQLQTALRVPDLVLDAPPATFTVTSPGRLVWAHSSAGIARLTATDLAFTSLSGRAVAWSASTSNPQAGTCLPGPGEPVGCGEQSTITVSPERLSATSDLGYPLTERSITVLSVPGGATGSVTLQLTTDDGS
ncbi:hypothetical protein [Nocardioides sp. Soil805]|uniref:hypothetical protein n=1 Tax=Nocardioides sp. Soil805 TaxID=1736416 RepID=UPI0007035D21|nr:hypothetical protein [Nocardioides sp. Soil805]KRF36648.1 hypothetical protein ASG94_04265 [Nocardioides sp. Soil805]